MKRIKVIIITTMFMCLQLVSLNCLKAATESDVYLKAKETVLGINEDDSTCDVNSDGTANVFDVIRIKQDILSLTDRVSACEKNIAEQTARLDSVLSSETINIWNEKWTVGVLAHNGKANLSSTTALLSYDYIPCDANTTYYAVCPDNNSLRIAQYRSDKTFIGFIGYKTNETFTTSDECAYLMFNTAGEHITEYSYNISINKLSGKYQEYHPHMSCVDYESRANAEKTDYIMIGEGQEYTSLLAGFTAAIAQDKGCIISPGIYDLVNEGVSSGRGLTAPKHIIGYGVKIVANLPAENWSYSPINISSEMNEVIIEGLEIEVTNCRYCVHDEEYNRADYYHHVFKNCVMKHNSEKSSTLIRPICIGGGFGNSCLVEIENCIFYSHDETNDVNYHANSLGQTGNCVVKCKDSVFETSIGITGNLRTGFVNEMYACGCLCGMLPTDPNIENSKMIEWNNTIRP